MTTPNQKFPPVLRILERLEGMEPLPPKALQTALETKILTITQRLRWIGSGLLVLMLVLASPVILMPELRAYRGYCVVVSFIGMASVVCALAWMIIDMIPGLVYLWEVNTYLADRRLLESKHDLAHVELLLCEDLEALTRTRQWVFIEMERIRARLSVFAGSPDKVALFSLAGLGWSVWKEVRGLEAGDWVTTIVQLGLALLCGTALGCFLVRTRLTRLTYHCDLLEMAIAHLDSAKKQELTCSPPAVPA